MFGGTTNQGSTNDLLVYDMQQAVWRWVRATLSFHFLRLSSFSPRLFATNSTFFSAFVGTFFCHRCPGSAQRQVPHPSRLPGRHHPRR
jgi:hypothetical protein